MKLTDYDKAQMQKIKHMTKIRILSDDHRSYISSLIKQINPTQINLYTSVHFIFFKMLNGEIQWTYTDSSIEFCKSHKYKEIFIDLPSTANGSVTIKPPFKFRNANIPVVRQWLKDNGYMFANAEHDIMEWNIETGFGFVDEDNHFSCSFEDYFLLDKKHTLVNFNLSIDSVTIDKSDEINTLQLELAEALKKVVDLETQIKELKE